jgi:hypothetical protein
MYQAHAFNHTRTTLTHVLPSEAQTYSTQIPPCSGKVKVSEAFSDLHGACRSMRGSVLALPAYDMEPQDRLLFAWPGCHLSKYVVM